ncbi:hypothetical protein GE061_012399 [Apolygus lucorum]|uniref:Uncharacterized protein n=1 Tax=Apolygus lucorum TaxID=248454 RepID=A0A6A4K0T6_APOLU|nr:hypothetical protein GE061_012399 [Apolygus lucorum]
MVLGPIPALVCAAMASGVFNEVNTAPQNPSSVLDCNGANCREVLFPPFKEVEREYCVDLIAPELRLSCHRCVAVGSSKKWVLCPSKKLESPLGNPGDFAVNNNPSSLLSWLG